MGSADEAEPCKFTSGIHFSVTDRCVSVGKLPSGTPGHASPADLFAPAAAPRVLQCFLEICDLEPFPLPPKIFILIYVVAEECLVRFWRDVPRETPLFDAMSKTL